MDVGFGVGAVPVAKDFEELAMAGMGRAETRGPCSGHAWSMKKLGTAHCELGI